MITCFHYNLLNYFLILKFFGGGIIKLWWAESSLALTQHLLVQTPVSAFLHVISLLFSQILTWSMKMSHSGMLCRENKTKF